MKKKIIIVLIIIILIAISMFLIVLIPSIKNNNYQKELLDNIYKNTKLDNISYLNKDNNYYIIKTENKIVVLDLNYEEVYSKESAIESTLPLVYKRNNLYYEEKIRKKSGLKYNYYSTDDLTLIFSSTVGGY